MSMWPLEATPELAAPPDPCSGAKHGDEWELRLSATYDVLRRMDARLWGAAPSRSGLRIDCWISRHASEEGIEAVEELGRLHGLCWSLPEEGEIGVPSYLCDGDMLRRQLDLLWRARAGWMILETGADLGWYVQVLLEEHEALADLEAVAGRFAPSRLHPDQRRALLREGFTVPSDGESRNARRSHRMDRSAARAELVETMQRVMHEVYGCKDHDSVVMRLGR